MNTIEDILMANIKNQEKKVGDYMAKPAAAEKNDDDKEGGNNNKAAAGEMNA